MLVVVVIFLVTPCGEIASDDRQWIPLFVIVIGWSGCPDLPRKF